MGSQMCWHLVNLEVSVLSSHGELHTARTITGGRTAAILALPGAQHHHPQGLSYHHHLLHASGLDIPLPGERREHFGNARAVESSMQTPGVSETTAHC